MLRTIDGNPSLPTPHNTRITCMDEPGPGGASHHYEIALLQPGATPPAVYRDFCGIHFQKGPIGEVGVNGVQQEDLLRIVADRLQSFQAGPFACTENATALQHVEAALAALSRRTQERLARGVEGRTAP